MEQVVRQPVSRPFHRLRLKALLALVLGVFVLAAGMVPGPWSSKTRAAVAWALSTRWQDEAGVRRDEHHLISFVEARSWGALLDLWVHASGGKVGVSAPVPVHGYRILTPFGWAPHAGGYRFSGEVLLSVSPGRLVYAPAAGRIVDDAGDRLTLVTATGARVSLYPLRVFPKHLGAVARSAILGDTIGSTLHIEAIRSGIPVNPGGHGLYRLRSSG
jgi:hypothetical protein